MKRFLLPLAAAWLCFPVAASAQQRDILTESYGPGIVRIFQDPSGGPLRAPEAIPSASILCETAVPGEESGLSVSLEGGLIVVKEGNRTVLRQSAPTLFQEGKTTLRLAASADDYYYGGGVQNGRFSHKGKNIAIENQNSWTDGGVSSPAPWFWSTAGYGILWNTFTPGNYSFLDNEVTLSHETGWLDIFVMAGNSPEEILSRYYKLTGAPVLLPKFAFYEGHLNAYNRDYWTPGGDRGILFEDGVRYLESQKPVEGGIRESLNGELPGNYQFSARAVVDRYEAADMPLGWILPNDGYGAGYGQTSTLEGNVANLKEFGDYARSKGVEIGLWTQSDLHPIDTIPALLQRDIDQEVGVAGVRVLKTDVAWVYRGYSFGLNGIADAASIMRSHGARPFIITLDGWAGTHRYGGIWSGDQTGGQWEYIRFHIPTYIGAGLSGQPNVSSDMDGIFGGKNEWVNIRDFQWKTFTPMELNMDGWGSNEKYPQALGERAARINRRFLKLKSALMPYTYSIAREAVDGLPMIRAIFLADANPYTLGTATRYEFLYGPSLLVAPIYQETAPDAEGNDIRDGIYLPQGEWVDYFTGKAYTGGVVLNNYPAPMDRLPVFVKRGAIIPMTREHNNPSQWDPALRIYDIYPLGHSSFREYDDDGRSEAYRKGECASTLVESSLKGSTVLVSVHPTQGAFPGMVTEKETILRIHTADKPGKIQARLNGRKLAVSHEWEDGVCVITLPKADVTAGKLEVTMKGFKAPEAGLLKASGAPTTPEASACNLASGVVGTPGAAGTPDAVTTATTITLKWNQPVKEGQYRRVLFQGMLYTGIVRDSFSFEDLQPDTPYQFTVYEFDGKAVTVSARTRKDPYEHAIKGISARCSVAAQGGQDLENLFDGVLGEIWHSDWHLQATPFEIVADLGAIYTLDKLEYVPRTDAGNGTWYRGTVSTSADGKEWTAPVPFFWERNANAKTLELKGVQAQFVKVHVDAAVGSFGSGRELFIYKVPGTGSYRHGVFNEKGEAVESID